MPRRRTRPASLVGSCFASEVAGGRLCFRSLLAIWTAQRAARRASLKYPAYIVDEATLLRRNVSSVSSVTIARKSPEPAKLAHASVQIRSWRYTRRATCTSTKGCAIAGSGIRSLRPSRQRVLTPAPASKQAAFSRRLKRALLRSLPHPGTSSKHRAQRSRSRLVTGSSDGGSGRARVGFPDPFTTGGKQRVLS